MELQKYVTSELLKYTVFTKEKLFLESWEFGDYIQILADSKTKEELQQKLLRFSEILETRTSLEFNYQIPALWTNYGLEKRLYSGSGGGIAKKTGFGSITQFKLNNLDNFSLISSIIKFICFFKYKNADNSIDMWNKLIEDTAKVEDETSYTIQILGELYLKLIPPKKLQELQIRFKSNRSFDTRSEPEKNSMPLDSVVTNNLLPFALQLAAQYNTSIPSPPPEAKIYFEHSGDGGFVNISRLAIVPADAILPERAGVVSATDSIDMVETFSREEELQRITKNLEFVRVSFKELVRRLETMITRQQPLPTNEKERKAFIERTFQEKLLEQREVMRAEGVAEK